MRRVVSEVRKESEWCNEDVSVASDDRQWNINQLLFADDTALVLDSEEKLCQLVEEFGRMCSRRILSE